MEKGISDYLVPPFKERLPDTVAAQVKSLILSKKIGEGEKLPSERELAVMLKVSRVVVRQAIMSLEQSGFIEIKRGPRGGSFVINDPHKPLADYIKDLILEGNLNWDFFFEARKVIEVFNIKKAINTATSKDIQLLRMINKQIIDHLKQSDIEEWEREEFHAIFYEINKEFHIAIANISGNPIMKGITRSLLENLYIYLMEQRREMFTSNLKNFTSNLYKRHERIIDYIERKDMNKCELLIKEDVGYQKHIDIPKRKIKIKHS